MSSADSSQQSTAAQLSSSLVAERLAGVEPLVRDAGVVGAAARAGAVLAGATSQTLLYRMLLASLNTEEPTTRWHAEHVAPNAFREWCASMASVPGVLVLCVSGILTRTRAFLFRAAELLRQRCE